MKASGFGLVPTKNSAGMSVLLAKMGRFLPTPTNMAELTVLTGGFGGVRIASDEHGSKVGVFGTDWPRASVAVGVDKHGGAIAVRGRDKEVRAFISVDKIGTGTISTWDSNGSRVK